MHSKKGTWVGAAALACGMGLAAQAAHAGAPTLSFAKSFGAPTVALNGSTSLMFTITNGGTAASNLAFTDNLPAGLVVATPDGLSHSCAGTVTAAPGGGSIAYTSGSIGPGPAGCFIKVDVTGTTLGAKVNATELTIGGASFVPPLIATATLTVGAALAAASIPTLGEWGLMLLMLAMAGSALARFRRSR